MADINIYHPVQTYLTANYELWEIEFIEFISTDLC